MKAKFTDPTIDRVMERAETNLTANLLNDSDVPTAPTALQYRIDDAVTGEEILPWTNLTPAAQVTITVTPEQNRILNRMNRVEERQLTLRGDNEATLGQIVWQVERVRGLA